MERKFNLRSMPTLLDIFDASTFMPHGHCFLWRPDILWLHVISDALVVLSYYSIPLALLTIVIYKRRNLEFHWMFLMFAVFIFSCGTTHVMDIITIWKPYY